MQKLESRNNEKLQAVRAIREGRERERIFVEGARLVIELLDSGLIADSFFVSTGFLNDHRYADLLERISGVPVPVYEVPDRVFAALADTKTPQGIIAIAKRPSLGLDTIASRLASGSSRLPIVVFLEEVNNPANLGAIVRTAEAAGAVAVITSVGSADAFSPKALRGAMGSAFRLPIAERVEIQEMAGFAGRTGLRIAAASGGSGINYSDVDWSQPRILAFGSEAHGVSDIVLQMSNEQVRIDIEPPVESLNLAVAAGVILFGARSCLERF